MGLNNFWIKVVPCLEAAYSEELRTIPDIRPGFASKEECWQENADHQRMPWPYADIQADSQADTEHLRTIPLIQLEHPDHQPMPRPSADAGACSSASHWGEYPDHQRMPRPSADTGPCPPACYVGQRVLADTLTDRQLAPIWGKGIQVGAELVPISSLMSLINLAVAVEEDARADGRCDIHPHVAGLGFAG